MNLSLAQKVRAGFLVIIILIALAGITSYIHFDKYTTFMLMIVFVIGLGFAILLPLKITSAFQQISRAIKRSMDANLNEIVDVKAEGEIGDLSRILNRFISQIKVFDDLKVKRIVEERGKLETTLNLLPECVIITDSENKVNFMNNACLQFFGLSFDNVTGKPLSKVRGIDEELIKLIDEATAKRSRIIGKIIEIYSGSGKRRIWVNIGAVRRSDGEVSSFVTVFGEILEERTKAEGIKDRIIKVLGRRVKE
ncbi:MAG TPA: PAS domain-containing protein [Candidatus Latescibacteria bacterium]|nr:PAS domain-containing protein [Candidatus Latescibacterota bacterium]